MALQNHPDKNGNTVESNNKFKQINDAYHYLIKEEMTHYGTKKLILKNKETGKIIEKVIE